MNKRITLVAKGKSNAQFLTTRLSSFLYKDVICQGFDLEELLPKLDTDLVLLSSKSLLNYVRPHLSPGTEMLVIRRAIDPENIFKLLGLKPQQRILVVNTSKATAEEVIELLYKMGFDYLWLIPYGPEMEIVPEAELAITPGEAELVPSGLDVVDIGTRVIDLSTLIEILEICGLMERSLAISAHYLRNFISLSKRIDTTRRQLEDSKLILTEVLNQISQAAIVVDPGGNIVQTNKKARDLWQNKLSNIDQLLDRKTNYPSKELGEVLEIRGSLFIVHKTTLNYDGKELYLFEPGDEVNKRGQYLRKTIRARGFEAKYSFNDIVGTSPAIRRTIEIAQVYAKSHLPVLIEAPTGCGKELFAHALHADSDSNAGPFVVVNCAALPDSLLESELFGYEEGAFTGARKGGKPGMFELANGGTVFIDEIEDLPLSVQVKLLRVLSEHEIIRVGGQSVIPIDVRVMAATNKKVIDLVNEGKFREDLLYRLNVLPLAIPTLRERKEDIPLLVRLFEKQSGKSGLITNQEVAQLVEYDWPGNIRELRNRVELLCTIKSTNSEHLNSYFLGKNLINTPPEENRGGESNALKIPVFVSTHHSTNVNSKIDLIQAQILLIINSYNKRGYGIGRGQLAKALAAQSLPTTEATIRRILHELEQKGLVKSYAGRRGTWLISDGKSIV